MKAFASVLLGLGLLFVGTGASAETVAGLPVHIHKFDSGAVRVWIGDHVSSTGTVAFATSKGIVVIDTTGDPAVDRELRRIVARELGRDDFAVLINTHEHDDHTGGNAVYADCEIVGHELVTAGMEAISREQPRMIAWGTRRVAELEQQVAGLAADDADGPRLREELAVTKLRLAASRNAGLPVPPTRTFADRLTLDMGDTRFELSYIGGMHSSSDIAVLVPEHRMLLTGDTMADVWLTQTPGCLASFMARPGVVHDFPRLLRNWHALLDRRDEVTTLVTGHWNGELTWDGFAKRVDYVQALWDGVRQGADAGLSLEAVQAQFALAERFPGLVEARGFEPRFNVGTIREMWTSVTGQRSAADALAALMADEAGFLAELARVQDGAAEYFRDEASLNGLGYRLLNEEKVPLAVAVFRANAGFYPGSWNVYDSLAEALLRAGDRAGAIANYERSVQMNPENANGVQALERIRSAGAGGDTGRI